MGDRRSFEVLQAHLRGRTGITTSPVEVGEKTYLITHPVAADALLDEEEFARDERLPYWAELWPSATALARRLDREDLSGRRVIELGCGVGLPNLAALERGARALATDHYEAALDFAAYNAQTNLGRYPETRLLDWRTPGLGDLEGSFDLVVAADVLYERGNVPLLAALIPKLLKPGASAVVADPRRNPAPSFLEEMEGRGFAVSTEEATVASGEREVTVLLHELRPRQEHRR
ncbi:methyltransferase domain-containing protein [Rubrobacter marinus]|uniref:Methyltransferase domain-containing protein n=1 Tax=Rubrobacter marinus TaxID=2653852 RepID=A0A6G8PZ66_9ACTN|nr:methyltransferase domain-containing protein [Rubrobacter marinus]QIN79468.1 methyltransferase domain-containing protein [Rubrobacter marinus]